MQEKVNQVPEMPVGCKLRGQDARGRNVFEDSSGGVFIVSSTGLKVFLPRPAQSPETEALMADPATGCQLFRGPRGGVFYITPGGTKRYVDARYLDKVVTQEAVVRDSTTTSSPVQREKTTGHVSGQKTNSSSSSDRRSSKDSPQSSTPSTPPCTERGGAGDDEQPPRRAGEGSRNGNSGVGSVDSCGDSGSSCSDAEDFFNGQYDEGIHVEQGPLGDVRLCVMRTSRRILAVRRVKTMEPMSDELCDAAERLMGIRHPNLVSLVCPLGGALDDDIDFMTLIEFAPLGTLRAALQRSHDAVRHDDARRYARGILEALAVLHEQEIMHGDVQCNNLFLFRDETAPLDTQRFIVKLGDLDLVRIATDGCEAQPEPRFSPQRDLHALGATVCEMFCTDHQNPARDKGLRDADPHNAVELISFVEECCTALPDATASRLLGHPWLQQREG